MKEIQQKFNQESQSRREFATNTLLVGRPSITNGDQNSMLRNQAVGNSTLNMNNARITTSLNDVNDPEDDIDYV